MTRLSTSQLLLGTALVAIGIGLCLVAETMHYHEINMLGFPLVGAGLLTPLGRPWLGAILGAASIALMVLWVYVATWGG